MLKIENLRAGYGAINVLWDVSLDIEKGKLTTIIGPNGAGKTTLLRAIMGLLPAAAGQIILDGHVLNGTPTWKMGDTGVTMIPEGRMTFRDMSVEENLIMGAFPKAHRAHCKARLEEAWAMFPRLHERRRQLAGSLSGGEAQMLAMARGLMSDPSLLIIDEPSLGLAPLVVNELFEILERLKDGARTIILVEQNTARAVGVADHVYLLQSGKVALSQPASEVDLEHLHALYFAR
ncbi:MULTISPECIES: ABC transporter ATP-binding protein [unclassified Janthinobacterium]|uniref:ABC transporter ATP-binding protein n=1 Tax=unclassified Janthinobacterium TaxID=2610881 RepID=UPI0016209D5D|nr:MULTISPECIES: ABC transporter ATP-binding protein [unclassified Janthinobacterium]MBB5366809.1 branched-chain amino acid transport system ATP-binding protein [Janthinobacterium sp. K2C7]MBB5380713.1 branched-chain amino acid transport system ATP-binding protein [Janthinobacterium sp. K2Li3]MBB5385191.1 branched-chain amino acid transport system ATP-binding protein [Janthinobacterium sp. K2E3]